MSRISADNTNGARVPKSPGFSMLELLTVIAIIGILAAIIFPTMSRLIPDRQLSNDARRVDALFQKARLRAATTQKPIRAVINCASASTPCVMELQAALYTNSAVSSWQTDPGERHVFNSNNRVSVYRTNPGRDGSDPVPTGVTYAIFMPDSRVYSDPKPYEIFIHMKSADLAGATGYLLTLSNDSGRVSSKKETSAVPVP
ncbi:MAG: prepilin-type N-terminal cleavage/methylation domain-containing protein [Deltaproteobacteria bacterium]|jgi:prepilin-type N-terminal cleavage/methylation domain-containing protein|nr:prepilin-type N-terminal cleavage/methylation domain-containing protein [Deltaproteobacteria bacterium]